MSRRPILRAGQRVLGYPAFARDGRTPIEGVVARDMLTDQIEVLTIIAPREVSVLYPPELLPETTVPTSRWCMIASQLSFTGLGVLGVEAVLWFFR